MDAIPYTVEARPDTGLNNVKIGMWLFLASEVMLFGGLFASYIILRVSDPNWPMGADFGLSVPLAFTNTVVLITSSVTMVMAWASLIRQVKSAGPSAARPVSNTANSSPPKRETMSVDRVLALSRLPTSINSRSPVS